MYVWCNSLSHCYFGATFFPLINLTFFPILFAKMLHFIVGIESQNQFVKYLKMSEEKSSDGGQIGACVENKSMYCQNYVLCPLECSCGTCTAESFTCNCAFLMLTQMIGIEASTSFHSTTRFFSSP